MTNLTKEHAILMENFKHSEGWKIISNKVEKMISEYENEILTANPEKNEVKYSEHDIYRLLRSCLIKIKNEPDRITSLFKGRKSSDYTSFI